jgi:hypothetical protein
VPKLVSASHRINLELEREGTAMLKIRLPTIVRSLVTPLALALPMLALSGCDNTMGTANRSISGTYAGSATTAAGTITYRLTLPEPGTESFNVSGTIADGGAPFEVRGTGIYDHPHMTFELVRLDGGVEDVFGVSATVNISGEAITIPARETTLVLRRN